MKAFLRTTSLALALLIAAAPAARAGITDQGGDLYSIEKRNILGSHELMFSLGTLPMDAFSKGLTLYGSYSYHFSQLIGWEIIGGMYSFQLGTGLKQELKDEFDVQPTELGELSWIINSNFVFKPLYGKLALLNDQVLAGELSFMMGPALGGFTASYPFGMDVGVSLRVFLGRYFSVRLDIREYLFFPGFASVEDNIYISLGLALTFGFGDEEKGEE